MLSIALLLSAKLTGDRVFTNVGEIHTDAETYMHTLLDTLRQSCWDESEGAQQA